MHVKNNNNNPIAYIPPTESLNFENKEYADSFLDKIDKIKLQYDENPIIKHHENKYGGKLPLWGHY